MRGGRLIANPENHNGRKRVKGNYKQEWGENTTLGHINKCNSNHY